jgi:hypothetical protein
MKREITLGEIIHPELFPKKKPIEFVRYAGTEVFDEASIKPWEFTRVLLLTRNYEGTPFDAMWAFDGENGGAFYIGHWNDGVIE